jgi:site-specific recombinase XerD
VQLADIDAYVVKLREGLSRRTVANVCHSIRAYLRFLYVTRRLKHDLATSVAAPRCRAWERPPRALPWNDVQAILRGVDRSTRVGRRDFALLLTMTAYGLGAAEASGLQLGDVDWSGGSIRVRRPKTGQEVMLPLLPAVGRALLGYLRHGRPSHATTRALFVQTRAPHGALVGSSAIRHVLVKHARLAGVTATFLGSHALRHSHASRQIDLGAPQKVVGDILGHRSPTSTSVYIRVAVRRLSTLALPVPR